MSGGQYLANITQNATRLGERIQESISERTRDLALNRGGLLDLADDPKNKNIAKHLESSSDREKLDAMKRLVALISKGRHVSEYFASVVKNVGSHNLEIRKLVYIYLLKYAEQEPDLALLSINTFQKDLNDSNPLIRAMALRVLSGIKVPSIGSIVVLAIKKCSADMSPYVRKAAALAIPKCHELDSSHSAALIGIISKMLHERSPLTIGCVIVAFEAVCPTRLDLLHKEYRRLCRMLVDVEEWGQVDLINLLLRYARTMLARPPHIDGTSQQDIDSDLQLLLTSAEPLLQSRNAAVVTAVVRLIYYLGLPSHQVKVVNPLLRLLASSNEIERVVLPYVSFVCKRNPELFAPFHTRFILRSDDLKCSKLEKIRILLLILTSDNYQSILREFIDYQDDSDDAIVAEAIYSIGTCATRVPESLTLSLTALTAMIKSPHAVIVSNAVLVLKRLVQVQMSASTTLSMTSTGQSPLAIISHLSRKLDDIQHSDARASILWLAGQYAGSQSSTVPGLEGVAEWAPDVLRKATKSFIIEPPLVKLQIITLAAKLFILSSSPPHEQLTLLCRYVFQLAKYDANYDVRDRARMLFSLLSGCSPELGSGENAINATGGSNGSEWGMEVRGGVVLRKEQVRLVLFEGKIGEKPENGKVESADSSQAAMILGSLSHITSKPTPLGQVLVPDWLEHAVDSSFRESPEEEARQLQQQQQQQRGVAVHQVTAISSQQFSQQHSGKMSPVVLTPRTSSPTGVGSAVGGSSKSKYVDLDAFYAEDESDEESDDDEEEDEEDEGDEEEEDSEEDDEEEEEEESSGDERWDAQLSSAR